MMAIAQMESIIKHERGVYLSPTVHISHICIRCYEMVKHYEFLKIMGTRFQFQYEQEVQTMKVLFILMSIAVASGFKVKYYQRHAIASSNVFKEVTNPRSDVQCCQTCDMKHVD